MIDRSNNRSSGGAGKARRTLWTTASDRERIVLKWGMPRLIDTYGRTNTLVVAVNHLLAEGGPRALTLRAIARTSGVSGSSVIHHFGCVEHLLHVALARTAEARETDIARRAGAEGVLAFLPGDPDGVVDARTWLAWREMARAVDRLEVTMADALVRERNLLAAVMDHRLGRDGLATLMAMVEGLRVAVCDPTAPMPWERARQLLTAAADSRSAVTIASGSSAE